jgi:hypothetical protein
MPAFALSGPVVAIGASWLLYPVVSLGAVHERLVARNTEGWDQLYANRHLILETGWSLFAVSWLLRTMQRTNPGLALFSRAAGPLLAACVLGRWTGSVHAMYLPGFAHSATRGLRHKWHGDAPAPLDGTLSSDASSPSPPSSSSPAREEV